MVFKSAAGLLVCPGPLHWLALYLEGLPLNTLISCPAPTSSPLPSVTLSGRPSDQSVYSSDVPLDPLERHMDMDGDYPIDTYSDGLRPPYPTADHMLA